MKIGIVTVYKSQNSGSYLQAAALRKALSEYAEDVRLVNSHSRSAVRLLLGHFRASFRKYRRFSDILGSVLFECKEAWLLWRNWRRLGAAELRDFRPDMVCLGGDEIWNASRKACRYPIFYGCGVSAMKFSYAVSIGNAEAEDFQNFPCAERLTDVKPMGVRDAHSKEMMDLLTGRQDAAIVLDPTLLFSPPHRERIMPQKYIAVYAFESELSAGQKEAIREYARRKGWALVSVGMYLDWCDRCEHSKDGNAFTIFEHAERVITNTFHGTAFSVSYRKRFLAIARGKRKVSEFLDLIGLDRRNVETEEEILERIDDEVDYAVAEERLSTLRAESFAFLEAAVRSGSENQAPDS